MVGVTHISWAERPHIDILQLETLYRNLGPYGAEALIARGLDDLDDRLKAVDAARADGHMERLHTALRDAAQAADHVAMTGIAQTARAAMQCIEDADPVAEAATLARLTRLADGAIGALNAVSGVSR